MRLPDPLRALHVITSTDAGGAETMLRRTLRAMRQRREPPQVHARVACLKSLGPVGEQLIAEGFEVSCLQAPPPGRGLRALAWPFSELRALLGLRRLMREFRPHVIQTWLPRADILGRLAAAGTGARVVSSVHVLDVDRSWPLVVDGLTRGLVAGRLAVSEAVADNHSRVSGIPRDQYAVIVNALEDWELEAPSAAATFRSRHGIPQDCVLLTGVARLHAQKGFSYLLDAMALLAKDEGARVMLAIAGDGPLRGELEEQSRRLGLQGSVRFLGRLSDPREILAAGDAFVLPSLYEGLPVALLEAMALSRACVATAIPGTMECARDGEHALIVPPRDAGALAQALRRLRDEPALRVRLGAQARARILAEFRMEQNAQKMLDLWARALGT